jgi:hypothetical protein
VLQRLDGCDRLEDGIDAVFQWNTDEPLSRAELCLKHDRSRLAGDGQPRCSVIVHEFDEEIDDPRVRPPFGGDRRDQCRLRRPGIAGCTSRDRSCHASRGGLQQPAT